MIKHIAPLLLIFASLQEERVKDVEYEESYAAAVKVCDAAEKDLAGSLNSVEEILGKLPRAFEKTLVVVFSSGVSKGAEKERHAFFPYRTAGRCAVAAGEFEKAIAYFGKSPSSADLLADAKKKLEEKNKPAPSGRASSVPVNPTFDPSKFLDANDFTGAMAEWTKQRDALGADAEKIANLIRRRATEFQAVKTLEVAAAISRLFDAGFAKEIVDPCLAACSRVPADLETPELRWVRSLGEWAKGHDVKDLGRLARSASAFSPPYQSIVGVALENYLDRIAGLVEKAARAPRAELQSVLEEIATWEAAFTSLADGKEPVKLRESLAELKKRLPVEDGVLAEARIGAKGVAAIRAMASKLDRLWTSDRRARLSLDDQKDLAMLLGFYRCSALFLDGKRVADVAEDPRVIEVFGSAGPLPADASPKIAAVRERIK